MDPSRSLGRTPLEAQTRAADQKMKKACGWVKFRVTAGGFGRAWMMKPGDEKGLYCLD